MDSNVFIHVRVAITWRESVCVEEGKTVRNNVRGERKKRERGTKGERGRERKGGRGEENQ